MRIALIDGDTLTGLYDLSMISEYGSGDAVELKRLDLDYFEGGDVG